MIISCVRYAVDTTGHFGVGESGESDSRSTLAQLQVE